eukprot:Protomagalhaensia_wolfi_Nauph_80__1593@NODE_1984_length_1256_cov_12_742810_g1552_i0_p1_GENE_NODE_1984_length_1256_cov_12_742810_g1552_i0NODE_1984_length_1256_cov_12_742810_g1552_i0_p1_ORF_typecomplete_len203_score7_95Methyltransf_31/PF13847_6/5_9e19Methyltransf_11/PF08241_12/1_6e18Methyltransf_23/PF13489_6/6_9e17Methyltransf_25/PF13649_6/3_4e13Methyltransf_12/PF08242_12/9_5e12TPMT/PF05724_11/9_8e12Ubie_methyltran/PF01209_18/1_6e11NodS/PF05401_11/2_3e09CMAS/PF02353_20/1_3e08MetW/PF07021_12/1e07Te
MLAQHSKKEYWDERYTKDPDAFEWYADYTLLRSLIGETFSKKSKILHVGCGTSTLAEDMAHDGFKDITSIDFSAVAVQAQQTRHKKGNYQLADIRSAPDFHTASFDAIIDKGTLDSLMCSDGAASDVNQMLSECHRLLKPEGVLFCVSHGKPTNRLGFFHQPDFQWQVTVKTIQRPLPAEILSQGSTAATVHVYVCKRNADS